MITFALAAASIYFIWSAFYKPLVCQLHDWEKADGKRGLFRCRKCKLTVW